jgi:mono/diheme cytochrome c family protein
LLLFGLLVVSGIAVSSLSQGSQALTDNRMLLLAGGIVGGLVAIAMIGGVLALAVNVITNLSLRLGEPSKRPAGPGVPVAGAPAPRQPKTPPPSVPLYNNRSRLWFYTLIGVGTFIFLVIRWLSIGQPPGYPLDRLPDLSIVLFTLPVVGLAITAGMAVVALIGALVVGTLVTGVVLARLTAVTDVQVAKAGVGNTAGGGGEGGEAKPGPKAAAPRGEGPAVPLYNNRSRLIFYVLTGVAIVGFLALRAMAIGQPPGYPLDRAPDLSVELFRIPGEPLEGFPEFLPGPGLPIRAWHVLIVVAGAALVGIIAVGVGLARGVQQATVLEKELEKAPPMWPSQEIAALEPRLRQTLARPFPPRLNGLDQVIILLFVVILGLIAFWVIPGLGETVAADRAVAATQIAAKWTPTPLPGPTATPLPSPADFLATLPPGDAANGPTLVTTYGCVACHIGPVVDQPAQQASLQGSAWLASAARDGKGISEHAAERWQSADYTGRAQSAQEYFLESITQPGAYVVPGFQNIMPATFAGQLSPQELADVIAYLSTLK